MFFPICIKYTTWGYWTYHNTNLGFLGILQKVFIEIIISNALIYILRLIFSVRIQIFNYYIQSFIWIKRIPKVQRKMNHSSLRLWQKKSINQCTWYEIQHSPPCKIKLNLKFSSFSYSHIYFWNTVIYVSKI
jgi:hypothetical protein